MNTHVISIFTACAFALTSLPVRADVSEEIHQELIAGEVTPSAVPAPVADSVDTESTDEDYSSPQGTEVSKADDSSKKAEKKQLWRNIGLAVSAVVVAIVALVIVGNNNGHHHHSH